APPPRGSAGISADCAVHTQGTAPGGAAVEPRRATYSMDPVRRQELLGAADGESTLLHIGNSGACKGHIPTTGDAYAFPRDPPFEVRRGSGPTPSASGLQSTQAAVDRGMRCIGLRVTIQMCGHLRVLVGVLALHGTQAVVLRGVDRLDAGDVGLGL